MLADDAIEERIPAPRRWVQPPPKLLTHLSDERLVARVRAGDDRAFEVLYDRHHRPLLAFCRHLLGSTEEAEDALQHTFIAAHRALRADERPVALRSWLFTIARNRCLSVLRSRRNVVALAEVEPTLPVAVGVTAQVEQRADLRTLVRDLHELSDDQRAALVLSELGDLDHEEIARILGVKRARVATLVFQARTSLMQTRRARELACSDIQQQLATLRGGALRRATLRRHVAACPACQAFREEVRRQRAALSLVLQVIPSLGLKRSVLSAISSGGGAAGAGAVAAGGVGGGIALFTGGAATGGATGAGAVAASSAAIVAATPAAMGAAAAAGGVSASVAAVGGAAVAAAGGAAVAAKALGTKVLLAAAIASGGPGLGAAADGIGESEKAQHAPSQAPLPAITGVTAPAAPTAKSKADGSKAAGTGQAGGSSVVAATGGGGGAPAAAGGASAGGPAPVAEETGSGAGVPDEVLDGEDGGTSGEGPDAPPVTPGTTSEQSPPPPPETTPAEPPATSAETPPPAETTTDTTPEPPPTTTTPEPPPTTSTQAPPPAEGAGSGEPVATGATSAPPEPVDPAPPTTEAAPAP